MPTTLPPAVVALVAILVLVVLIMMTYRLILRFFGVVIIREDCIGIVNKKFVLVGSHKTLPDGQIIALNGEAGYQADTLAPGIHFLLWPWQYAVTLQKFIAISEGNVGVVEASGGNPLCEGRVLGKAVDCDSFQSVRAFLERGGERGPQIAIIPPGVYRINTIFFSIAEVPALEIADNMVGIVTTKDGTPLATGDIAGTEIPNHRMFQDAQQFVNGGGFKGLQEQVLLAGRYFINPRFATVELKPMTEVPIANVGVVIAYVGAAGIDLSGEGFKHGNLVSTGQKGVWAQPLDPGKYPINPYTHRVECVPTANVVLNWATGKSESHNLDKNLSTITVRSSDGFTFNLDVAQIIHIPRNDAPKVIARFGTVANLVTQVLEPTIGNYFRNAAQGSDAIEFLRKRQERQESARAAISAALADYNVGAVDTLIGDIVPPAALMTTLTDRKIAEQQKVTYETQMLAQGERQKLEQATALAATQARVVDAERQVTIAEFSAQASVKKAEGEAKSKTIQASADAQVLKTVGDATAVKTLAIGNAEAAVTKAKIESMEAGNYAAIQVAQALSQSGFRLVPDIMVAGGANGQGGGTLVDVLLANLIRDQVPKSAPAAPVRPPSRPAPDADEPK
ncbi:MAG: SPFH domain-containing protein [Chthoniobacter sp.]|uniref:SPFH domain-containing protein n=1 Tax=Chthoniobacter sp. TaxID=2510640 RepID=UPI0032A9EC4B